MKKQFSLLKPNTAHVVLPTTSLKLVFQSVLCTVESHKQFALAHSNYLRTRKRSACSNRRRRARYPRRWHLAVVHVDSLTDHKDYLHRSGRTAPAGEVGGVVVLATTKQQTSVKGLTSRAGVTPKFVYIKPNDAELMTITSAQEPSRIPYITPITESRGPSRSGSKRPRSNSSQRQRRPR